MSNRQGKMLISEELLVSALGLPVDTEIQDLYMADSGHYLVMIVSHPDLPAVSEGELLPRLSPTWERPVFNWGW